jgi:hypothetical protein
MFETPVNRGSRFYLALFNEATFLQLLVKATFPYVWRRICFVVRTAAFYSTGYRENSVVVFSISFTYKRKQ